MFTGIIEELGRIKSIELSPTGSAYLQVYASLVLKDLKIGDSVAVNGCCLTVVDFQSDFWCCDIVKESLYRTNLGHLQVGDVVNLERPLQWHGRLHGHLVQGHVDGIASIQSKNSLHDGSWWVTIEADPSILRYVVHKGSIAVDGISLTVAELTENTFSIAMIPHTTQMTTLGFKSPGAVVNLEVDLMAKYAERLLAFAQPFANREVL